MCFFWYLEIVFSGLVVVVVSLDEQNIYVYCNGVVIGVGLISLGKFGYEMLLGVYSILQKECEYCFNFYDDVLMLYMQWFIWDGIVLYGGILFGYLVLYGCVCLFQVFVEKLFVIIQCGGIVVVVDVCILFECIVYLVVVVLIDLSGVLMLFVMVVVLDVFGIMMFVIVLFNLEVMLVSVVVSIFDCVVYVFCGGLFVDSLLFVQVVDLVFIGIVFYVMIVFCFGVFEVVFGVKLLNWLVYCILGDGVVFEFGEMVSYLYVLEVFGVCLQ